MSTQIDIESTIRSLLKQSDIGLYAACYSVGLNPQNVSNKFSKGTLYFSDVEKLLSAINYHVEILPNNIKINFENAEKPIDR
jgi:hypothetical protein